MGKQIVEIKEQMTEELQRVREQLETIATNAMDGPQRWRLGAQVRTVTGPAAHAVTQGSIPQYDPAVPRGVVTEYIKWRDRMDINLADLTVGCPIPSRRPVEHELSSAKLKSILAQQSLSPGQQRNNSPYEGLKAFEYTPLENGEIRLLEIQPGREGEAIGIKIIHKRLSDRPKYQALSYVWGNPTAKKPVICDDGKAIFVTINCFSALLRLRNERRHSRMWIDAICINQNNIAERSSQVALMTQIYRYCQGVIIYLGEDGDDSSIAIQCLRKVQSKKRNCPIRKMCSNSANHDKKEVVALRAFFSRPWFKRVWVLQEIRNGPHPQVICGTEKFSWRHIADLTGYGFPSTTLGVEPAVLGMQNAKHYGIGLPAVGGLLTPENLFEMLVRARHCLSTDPRDKAFALLSLFDAVGPSKSTQGFIADYSISTSETFVRLASYLLQSAKVGTQLLSAIEPGSTLDGLPSWVPDWSLRPAESSLAFRDCFKTGNISQIYQSNPFSCYSLKMLSATTLQVTGIHVDRVTKIIQCYHKQRWMNMVVGDRKQDTHQTAKGLKRNYYELLWPYNWYDKSERLCENAQRTAAGLHDSVPLYVGAAVDYWDRSDARKDLRNVQVGDEIVKIWDIRQDFYSLFILRQVGQGYIIVGKCFGRWTSGSQDTLYNIV
ncbi:uncharacterized protein FRV6_16566 [Fusarium oxysporum]|uniref:Heterokaryon incompatibility domain-containing protein n=1 Tax=Fusarium oxysporum TaxID=5507 RepID=A0A2H3TV01_FUSOX|nr:uncharacterized protein FRV6_16566 [Fusarium oxysporum]